jgi:penicillin-binding protein 1B
VTAVLTTGGETLSNYPLRLMPLDNRGAVALVNFALTRVVERGTARQLQGLLGSSTRLAGKTGTTNERRDSWFAGYSGNRVGVTWVGRDDNRPAGVTGSNAAMRVWAGLFSELPLEPVDLQMPEGANYVWVDIDRQALTGDNCPRAVQMPFIEGTEPRAMTRCLEKQAMKNRKSLWRKWFEDEK